jgi:hypothetical protein
MEPWDGWELGRVIVAFSGLLYAGVWVQVSLFHRAGAFKHPAMYAPVLLTPLMIGGALAGVLAREGAWGWVAASLLGVGVLDGLIGVVYHLLGVRSQIGGFTMRNLIAGPPFVLPLAYALFGVLGLLGLFWKV